MKIKLKQITLKNIWAYIQGNIRYRLYYNKRLSWLIPSHIKEQIECRINSMDRECYLKGMCKLCGCQTTALQMANKACDKPCYPVMLPKDIWYFLKRGAIIYCINTDRFWKLENNKFITYKEDEK